MNRRFNDFIVGVLLMPFMALTVGVLVWATHGWILLVLPAMVPLTLFHDFIWWPLGPGHCMTCRERSQSAG